MTDQPNPDDIAQQLAAVTDYVRQCQSRVARGEMMDLSGLDRTVATLCGEITQLPRADATAMEPQMHKLVEALDALAADMKAQKERMLTGGG